MGLAILRRTSEWLAMLCVAIALSLAGETTVQAFEMAEHASLHAAEASQDAAGTTAAAAKDSREAADLRGEGHHHPADHHSIGVLTELAATDPAPEPSQAVPPASGLRRAGVVGYGVERPPKA